MIDIFQGRGEVLDTAGFGAALAGLGTPAGAASLWAVISVETRGFGFLPDRRPKILFERHIFHERTKGRFSAAAPDISNPDPGGYQGGAGEYQRLKRAMLLDRAHALESASWGLGQVMGFNAAGLGYADAEAMVRAFMGGEAAQLDGCVRFINANPALAKAYKAGDWARVAFFYNGKSYAKNAYDKKLAAFHTRYATAAARPDLDIRRAQAHLAYLGFDPRGIDGAFGAGTKAALEAFERSQGPGAPSGVLDTPMMAKIAAAAGF